ncbi:MAG: hypothetical protein ACFFBP_01530 [Promethearchaeota archaeon]
MTIDKWMTDESVTIEKKKRDEKFNSLSIEKKEDLKKKQIRKLLKNNSEINNDTDKREDILCQIIKFKDWLNNRNYLKGDIEKIEVWIKNLNELIILEQNRKQTIDIFKRKELFKEIPPNFLDEKFRMIINKKINAKSLNNSDRYYLKKLKTMIQKKLKEARYYEILKKILED